MSVTLFKPREPVWVDIGPASRIQFRPVATAGMIVAQGAALAAREAGAEDEVAGVAFSMALAKWGALSWEGVEDEDGLPIQLAADLVGRLLEQNLAAYLAVEAGYVSPALLEYAEKNGSSPSPDGGSAA